MPMPPRHGHFYFLDGNARKEYNILNVFSEKQPMERISDILKRIMLALLMLLLLSALMLALAQGFENRSYLIAVLLGAIWAAGLYLLLKRLRSAGFEPEKLFSRRKAALFLTALCLIMNLVWVLIIRIEPWSDYLTYWQCACALASGGEIDAPWYIAMYPHILGCASFLSVFVKLFGEHVMAAALVNVALTCASGLLIFYICLEITSFDTACLAFLFWAVYPSKLMLNSLVFSEPLYTCIVLVFIYALLLIEKRSPALSKKLPLCILIGALLGAWLRALNIVRPIAAIVIIALFIWLLLLRGKELKNAAAWKMWLVIMLPLLAVYSVTGKLWDRHVENVLELEPASVPIYNIYVGFNEDTHGQWSADDMDLLFSYLSEPGTSASEAQQSMIPHLKERLSSGIDYFSLFKSKLFAFIGADELGGYSYRYTRSELFVKICMVIDNIAFYGILLLSLFGLFRMLKESGRFSAALLMPLYVLGLSLAHMLVEVSTRYHYSVIPFIIIFAATALDKPEGAIHDT